MYPYKINRNRYTFDTTKYLSCSKLYKNIWLHDNKGMHLSNFAFSHLGHELCALGTWYNNSNEKKFDNIILNWKRRVLLCWATRVIERQSFHISMRRRRNILYEINSYSMSFRLWKSVFWDCKKFFVLSHNIWLKVIFDEIWQWMDIVHLGDKFLTAHFYCCNMILMAYFLLYIIKLKW